MYRHGKASLNYCMDCGIEFVQLYWNQARCRPCQHKHKNKVTQNWRSNTEKGRRCYIDREQKVQRFTCFHCGLRGGFGFKDGKIVNLSCPLYEKGYHRCQYFRHSKKPFAFNWMQILTDAGVFAIFTPEEIQADRV